MDRLRNRVPGTGLTNAHAVLGNADEAFNYLIEALSGVNPA